MRSCYKFKLGVPLVFCICVVISVCMGAVVCADEFTKVPTKVNVLKGVDANDSDIKEIIKECNKILKQAKIELEFDSKNVARDVNDTGNKDGKIQETEEKKLDEAGQKELKDKFGAGKGIKIYIANKIRDSNSTRGLAPHSKEKDGKLTSKPVIYIKNLLKVKNKSRGNDLAHETCHVLTLGKNHWIDKSKGKKADDNWHDPNDPNDLMYPYNPYTKDGKPLDRGSKLTDDQIKEIQKGAKRLGKTKVAKKKTKKSKIAAAYDIAPLPTVHGGFVDEIGETGAGYTDLGAGFLFAETPSSQLQISLLLEGMFPDIMGGFVLFSVYFNTDNNDTTGETYYDAVGVDKIIDMEVWNSWPGAPFTAYLFDVATYQSTPLPCGTIERVAKVLDGADEPGVPEVTDYVDGLFHSLPICDLELTSDVVPVWVVSKDLGGMGGLGYSAFGDFDQVAFLWQLTDPNAVVFELLATRMRADDELEFTGRNFTAGSEVEIFLDDEPIGTAFVEPDGTFEGSFPWSVWHSSAVLDPYGYYFVTARDTSGSFDFSIVEVGPNPADLNTDGIVDFKDFAFFADNWLSTGVAILVDE